MIQLIIKIAVFVALGYYVYCLEKRAISHRQSKKS